MVFDARPTLRACMAQSLFWVGTGRRAVAHTARSLPKMPTAPSAFPLLGAPQAPGNEPNPPRKGIKAWGEGPLRPKEISRYRDTLGQIRAADNTAGRSATRHLEMCQTDSDLRYLMHAPTYGHVWHKAFFGWDRAQGRSPHAPGVCQKCPRPRRHYPC